MNILDGQYGTFGRSAASGMAEPLFFREASLSEERHIVDAFFSRFNTWPCDY